MRPNVGIEVEYRRRLDAFLAEMQASLEYWLTAAYRRNEPRIAQDWTPADRLRRIWRRIARRWQRRIDDMAPKLATWFATAATKRSDAALAKALKDGGFAVEFDATPVTTDIFRATVNENVSLIRSIGSEHLSDVEQLVMRSVSVGGDMGELSKALQDRYGITKRRAALISKDQNAKATASVVRARQVEIGATTALWKHSAGGKRPRASHLAFNDHEYDVREGVVLDGERCWPGTAINCRCVSRTIIPGLAARTSSGSFKAQLAEAQKRAR